MPTAEPLLCLEDVRLPGPGWRGGALPLSLEVRPGESAAVAGSTLAGAVLVRACLGLARPRAGRIRLLGTDVSRASEEELARMREGVGAVLAPHGLVANLTIRENLLLPLVFRRGDHPEEPEGRVEEVLAALELVELGDERPGALGPGATERVAVARALVRRPRLLVMENLDAALTGAEIRRVMELCRGDGRAILVTATEPTSATCSTCDLVVDLPGTTAS